MQPLNFFVIVHLSNNTCKLSWISAIWKKSTSKNIQTCTLENRISHFPKSCFGPQRSGNPRLGTAGLGGPDKTAYNNSRTDVAILCQPTLGRDVWWKHESNETTRQRRTRDVLILRMNEKGDRQKLTARLWTCRLSVFCLYSKSCFDFAVGRWLIFYVFCSENIMTKLVGCQQPTCLCVKMEFAVGTISLSCELYSLSWSCFLHVGSAQLCTGNGASLYMCSSLEVAWLAPGV